MKTFIKYLLVIILIQIAGYIGYIALGGNLTRDELKGFISEIKLNTTYEITDSGGDCDKFGEWSQETKICRLTSNFEQGESISIDGNEIIFDGNNHSMTGNGETNAITVISNDMVIIRNLEIDNYYEGVVLQNTTGCIIDNLKITNTKNLAINGVSGLSGNIISNNIIEKSDLHGIAIWSSSGNLVINNFVKETKDGIRFQNAIGNIIIQNTLQANRVEGLDFHDGFHNVSFHNNFFLNEEIQVISDVDAIKNIFESKMGGNYYDNYDTEDEGCIDSDNNERCDIPFKYDGVIDNAALTSPVLWKE